MKARDDTSSPASRDPWWHQKHAELLGLMNDRDAAYVYNGATIDESARAILAMTAIDRPLYAMKANSNPLVLQRIAHHGFGFECVSKGELERLHESVPGIAMERVLFTPNFAPRHEYAYAMERGARVTVDNLEILEAWPELFKDRSIFVRVDTGRGHGHHRHVRTAGQRSKFGVPIPELRAASRAASAAGAEVVGLHAHTGSGNFELESWVETAEILKRATASFAGVRILDLGGGLGVPERPDQAPLDLLGLDRAIARAKDGFEVWLEPGRYLVAKAGVLLARVTQTKGKGEIQFVGVATGMNSLIRPALYGAHHEIVNLTRIEEPATDLYDVVGPICESGDVFGRARALPKTRAGDVLLIASAGAYGHAMSSSYNLREPAEELMTGS
ncbi:MAG: diaminopimelate decarboxylase [Deltaproteobacteria bacterium]|nr:diaminopimelate decarboxylase [Deltaproteobacteria bacterium]